MITGSSNEKYFQISSHDILSSTQTGQTGKLTLFFVQKQGDRKAKLRLLTLYVSSSLAAAKWASEINALAWRSRPVFNALLHTCLIF